MRQVLQSGVPTLNVEYRAFLPPQARKERTLTASLFRLDDAQGRALGVRAVRVRVGPVLEAFEPVADEGFQAV
ncbi:hypothetical protein ABZ904_45030 [Streptomyces sp. NPDC046900]|uniref:hypothetical protein n=1 Tax=Streptomyces sp. NPDC046900 TaxID=3155473 RepID=UPI0033E6BC12